MISHLRSVETNCSKIRLHKGWLEAHFYLMRVLGLLSCGLWMSGMLTGVHAQDVDRRMDPDDWFAQDNISTAFQFGQQVSGDVADWGEVAIGRELLFSPIGHDGSPFWLKSGDLRLVLDAAGTNLSVSHNIGFNYGAFSFVHRGRLMSLGGMGFWERHAKLIEFSEATGEWELLSTNSGPGSVKSAGCWLEPRGGAVLAVSHATDVEPKRGQVWKLDLRNFKWERLGVLTEVFGAFHPGSDVATLETADFVCWVRNHQSVVIRKSDHSAVLSKNWLTQDLTRLRSSAGPVQAKVGKGNVIEWWGPGASGMPEKQASLDLANLFSEATLHMEATSLWEPFSEVPEEPSKSANAGMGLRIPALLLALLVGIGGGWAFGRRRPVASVIQKGAQRDGSASVAVTSDTEPEANPQPFQPASTMLSAVVLELEALGASVLTSDELNAHLGLDGQVSSESRRARRAQFIRDVNREYQLKYGVDLIFREQDPNDRRRTQYIIRPH